jgi:hypothetical protein
MGGLKLFQDERLLREIKPHPLAFWDMYLVWVWIIVVSLLFMSYGEEFARPLRPWLSLTGGFEEASSSISGLQQGMPPLPINVNPVFNAYKGVGGVLSPFNSFMAAYGQAVVWFLAIVMSALAMSVLKIQWKWVFQMACVGALSIFLSAYFGMPASGAYYFGVLFSVLGAASVEVYRRAHTFYITNMRIVTEVDFTSRKRNELTYDKVNNVVLEQDLLGSLFGFGTIIPVTASGLGMGSDFSAVSVDASGRASQGPTVSVGVLGGRSVQTPRVRSMYGIFGVEDPDAVHQLISENVRAYVQAPYLRKMTEQLDDLKKSLGKGGG